MSESEAVILRLIREDYFRVDIDGRIWRVMTCGRTGRLRNIQPKLTDGVRDDGYRSVRVQIQGVEYFASAHRIVWMHFNGSIHPGMEINHKNGKRGDNRPSNLEPLTPSGNTLHSYRELGRLSVSGERNGRHKLTGIQVDEIRRRHSDGAPKKRLAREFGVTPTLVRKIIAGDLWSEFPRPVEVAAS